MDARRETIGFLMPLYYPTLWRWALFGRNRYAGMYAAVIFRLSTGSNFKTGSAQSKRQRVSCVFAEVGELLAI